MTDLLRAILAHANAERPICFTRDWGGNSLTVHVDGDHSHCGDVDGDEERLEREVLAALGEVKS